VPKYAGVCPATTTSSAAQSVSRARPTMASAAIACTARSATDTARGRRGSQHTRANDSPNRANAASHGPACVHGMSPRAIAVSVTDDDTIQVPNPAIFSHDSGLIWPF
jgi:hypothetical protein